MVTARGGGVPHPHPRIDRKRVTMLYRPVDSARAARIVEQDKRNDDDSLAHTMLSVVINPYFDWGHDHPPQHEYHESVIYEAHVKGLTMTHPDVPEDQRGTYAGLCHPVTIEHLQRLGVTTVELLPVHAIVARRQCDGRASKPSGRIVSTSASTFSSATSSTTSF